MPYESILSALEYPLQILKLKHNMALLERATSSSYHMQRFDDISFSEYVDSFSLFVLPNMTNDWDVMHGVFDLTEGDVYNNTDDYTYYQSVYDWDAILNEESVLDNDEDGEMQKLTSFIFFLSEAFKSSSYKLSDPYIPSENGMDDIAYLLNRHYSKDATEHCPDTVGGKLTSMMMNGFCDLLFGNCRLAPYSNVPNKDVSMFLNKCAFSLAQTIYPGYLLSDSMEAYYDIFSFLHPNGAAFIRFAKDEEKCTLPCNVRDMFLQAYHFLSSCEELTLPEKKSYIEKLYNTKVLEVGDAVAVSVVIYADYWTDLNELIMAVLTFCSIISAYGNGLSLGKESE